MSIILVVIAVIGLTLSKYYEHKDNEINDNIFKLLFFVSITCIFYIQDTHPVFLLVGLAGIFFTTLLLFLIW